MLGLTQSIIFGLLFFGMLAMPARAQTPDQERVKQLEQENDALRQELAQLRLELSQLKRELAKYQPTDKPTADDADGDETSDSPEAGEEGDSKDKNKPRTFRSADEIYRLIPRDMRPARDGWDIPQKKTVALWLKTNITGKRFEARKEISQVKIKYDSIRSIWEFTLYFEKEEMSFMSWDMEERVYGLTLRGDKTFVENLKRKHKEGSTVHLSGTISTISWDTLVRHSAEENWHPTYCQIALDSAQIK